MSAQLQFCRRLGQWPPMTAALVHLAALTITATLVLSPKAQAELRIYDRGQSETEYHHGNEAMDAGNFEAATQHFARAVQWAPDASLVYYNAALAWKKLNRCDQAGFYFRWYLEISTQGKYGEPSRLGLAECEASKSTVVTAAAAPPQAFGVLRVSAAGMKNFLLNGNAVDVLQAEMDLVVAAGPQRLSAGQGKELSVDVAVGRRAYAALWQSPSVVSGAMATPSEPLPWRWVLTAGAGVGLASGVAFDVLARSSNADMKKADSNSPRYRSLRDRYFSQRTASLWGYGAALVLGGGAAWLWWQTPTEPSPSTWSWSWTGTSLWLQHGF